MSLLIYDRNTLPADVQVIRFNDAYFDNNPIIPNTNLAKSILKDIDNGTYVTSNAFKGRTPEMGNLDARWLSTGTKTLFNIISNPDVCFDVCECGLNALTYLFKIKMGMVYWKYAVLPFYGDPHCDVIYGGRQFTDVIAFLDYAMYGDDNCD